MSKKAIVTSANKAALEHGDTIEEAAQHLCRSGTLPEVRRKARELGLTWARHIPSRPMPTHKITAAYVLSRPDGYWMGFEFDDDTTYAERAASKEQAEFDTRDRIGDDVSVNGSPLLRPGSKHPVGW